MKVLGITGGLGSGKSTICRIFSVLGIPVYEADAEVKHMYSVNDNLAALLAKNFPAELFDQGRPDTRKFATYFFGNSEALQQLNELVHPFVREHFTKWLAKQSGPYVLKETAILFESGSDSDCDKTASISAPETLRIERVSERDKRSRTEIKRIMAHQWTDEQRAERADYVIVNDEQQLVLPQVLQVHRQMIRLSQAEK